MELTNALIMMLEGLIHQFMETIGVFCQHARTLFKADALWTIAAVVGNMTGGLVRQQIYMYIMLQEIFQKIDHIPVVGNGVGDAGRLFVSGYFNGFLTGFGNGRYPALVIAGHDTGNIYFGYDGYSAGNLCGLALGAAHAAQTGGNEQASCQVLVLWDAKLETTGIQQGIEGAVDDALGPDIHPTAGSHLAVIGHADGCSPIEAVV